MIIVFISTITASKAMDLVAPVARTDPPDFGLDLREPHDTRTSAEMTGTCGPASQRRYDLVNFDFATPTPPHPETPSSRLP
ncbi:MAG: hypothetical protein ACYDHB_02910 [Candidatus Dormibacteria bacterium]